MNAEIETMSMNHTDHLIEEKNDIYSVTLYGEEILAKLWDVEQKTEDKILSILSFAVNPY